MTFAYLNPDQIPKFLARMSFMPTAVNASIISDEFGHRL